jgi:8-oxo-dGTP pyrophosphatase MutT (NUDIX family)
MLQTTASAGIPAGLRRRAYDADNLKSPAGHAAGTLYVAPDGDVLLLRRSSKEQNYPGYWALPGGKAEDGETPEIAARREALEEMGSAPEGDLKIIDRRITPTGMVFHTFGQPVAEKFVPKLNDEHAGYAWAPLSQLPGPLHPAVADTIKLQLLDGREAQDMAPEDWTGLIDGLLKFFGEEAEEPEHQDKSTAQDSIAMDRESVRRFDQDGHLHIERTPISKANICPYWGREIPGFDQLGLDPNKTYKLLRHPDELKKGASTFDGKPLLHIHKPVSADQHPRQDVVGSIGTNVEFEHPYLWAPLSVWDGNAIKRIESGDQKELSSGYQYKPDMTPGTYEGEPYDGVMRDIVGNHVALVEEGRAGPDVVVGDAAQQSLWAGKFALDETEEEKEQAHGKLNEREEAIANKTPAEREEIPESVFLKPTTRKYPVKKKIDGEWKYSRDLLLAAARRARLNGNATLAERADAIRKREFGGANDHKESTMAGKTLLTRKAAVAQGALMTYLAPKLANDAKIDLTPILAGITVKNYDAKRADIAASIKKATAGKLAQDANLEDLTGLLDALKEVKPSEDEMAPNAGMPQAGKVRGADEEDTKGRIREFLKDKLSEDDMKACDELWDDGDEQEAMDEEETEAERKARAESAARDEEKAQKAMDAAIKKATDSAVKQARELERNIRSAEEDAARYVGRLSIAFDSAEEVYKTALTMVGVDVTGVHPSAYKAILHAQPVPGSARHEGNGGRQMATDAASGASFYALFPEAKSHPVKTL